MGTQEGQGGGSWGGLGFPEDRTGRFYKRIFVGGGTVNFLGHLGPSGVSLWASFFLFLIYNCNIYEYINITNVCEHEADTPEVRGSEGKSHENPSLARSSSSSPVSGQRGLSKSGGMSFAVGCELPSLRIHTCHQEEDPNSSHPGDSYLAAAGEVPEGPSWRHGALPAPSPNTAMLLILPHLLCHPCFVAPLDLQLGMKGL